MRWVEAVVKIVTGLAWPSVVIVAVLVLRRELGRLIGRMTHFKGPGGVEADFPSQAAATNELSEEAVPNAPTEMTLPATEEHDQSLAPPESLTLKDLLREAEAHPVGAVVRAWNLVENVVERGFAHTSLLRRPGPRGVRGLARTLLRYGVVSDDIVGLADRLSELRDQVVHGRTIPDTESALDFVEAAWRLAVALQAATPVEVIPPGNAPSPAARGAVD